MALTDCKIKNEDFANMDIASLSDRPSADGMSAQALKERFDASTKHIVQPKFNQLIEMLTSQEGADNIGITPIEGVAGYTVQQILTAVKILLDDKQSIEQSNKDVEKKFDKTEAQALVKSINFTKGTGVFTITKYDGTEETIDTPIEKIPLDVRLDGQDFVLTLDDGTEQRVDISKFLTETEVKNSDTITLAIESGVIVARLVSGSVTMAHLNPEVTAYIEAKEQSAANSAASASVSEQNALNSANSAEQSHQNAKTCQEQACLCATQADLSRKAAATSESNAKASEQAAKQSETKSATSEANAKASEQKAATSESNASGYEQGALQNAQTAEQAAETAVNAMNNASASEQNAKASETASQTNKEASDTSANSAAESARAAAESAKRAEEEANRAADNAGGDFATRSELQVHTTAENPHNIDAETVGLGNVPNVATNDQTPTYEVAANNAELASGEKLSTAFGKIAKAVSSFISHLANRENPHEVTAEQAGAVKTDLSNVDNEVFKEKAEEAGLGGDFLDKEVYDPQGKAQDVFQYADDALENMKNEMRHYDVPVQNGGWCVNEYSTIKDKADARDGIVSIISYNGNGISDIELTNPNLLDNWYFKNPINRNGQLVYSGGGFFIDRWYQGVHGKVDILEDGIKITDTVGGGYHASLIQSVLVDTLEKGEYTFSVLIDEVVTSTTIRITPFLANTMTNQSSSIKKINISEPGLHSITFSLGDTTYSNLNLSIRNEGGSVNDYMVIRACKLEMGDTQTLAHRDSSGKWVLNEVPNYVEEVAKCVQYSPSTGKHLGVDIDTTWYAITEFTNGTPEDSTSSGYWRSGDIITLHLRIKANSITLPGSAWITVFTLPVGFRPSRLVENLVYASYSGELKPIKIGVLTDGTVRLYYASGGTASTRPESMTVCNISFCLE